PRLFRRERFLARFGLRIGDGVDFLQHLAGRSPGGQLVHDHLPLAAREALDVPAGANAHRTPPGCMASLSSLRGVMIWPPPGKSGPLMCFINPETEISGSRIMAIAAADTSFRLWL